MKIKRIIFPALITVLLLLITACNLFHPKLPPSTAENMPPETHVSIFYHPDTTLNPGDFWVYLGDTTWINDTLLMGLDTTVSVQEIHWWGDDPDGDVIGYYYRWSYMDEPVFTQDESAKFYLPLRTQFDIYSFHVQAIDNDSLIDPTPAVASFPVFNSPPTVEWKLNSLPVSTRTEDSLHYSFTHHSFFWDIEDIDGEETITEIFYALDDTSDWQLLDGEARSVMIQDIPPGKHRIFLKVRDIADAKSNVILFPDPNDQDTKITSWVVKEPVGDILIVNDWAGDQALYKHQNFYKGVLDEIVGPTGYSVWEIGGARTNTANTIPYSPEDIELNLSSFSKVFWFTYQASNNVSESSLALTRFVADGGILLMDNAQSENIGPPDTTWTFTDIDSSYVYSATGRIFPGINIVPVWEDTMLDTTLILQTGKTVPDKLYAILPGSSSTLRYHFAHDSLDTGVGRYKSDYKGTPPIMIETPIGDGTSYYFSVPLYFLNGNENIDDLFRHIFEIDG